MSDKVDRKLREVAVAEYRYRHEAEFAAGFLDEAGIPYRLQLDDAGANLGLAALSPAVLWVRGMDAEAARELIGLDEDVPGPPRTAEMPARNRPPERQTGRLSGVERGVSAGLAVAFLATAPNLPPMPLRAWLVALCFMAGLLFLGTAAIARAPGPLADLLRMISGSPPQ